MSLNFNDVAGDEVSSSYWKAVKVAVAIACIRSKPEELTAEEYALQLHAEYWKRSISLCSHYQPASEFEPNKFIRLSQDCLESDECSRCLNMLVKCQLKFVALEPFLINYEVGANAKFIKEEIVEICMTVGKNMKQITSCKAAYLPYNVLSGSVTIICKGIKFFESPQNLRSFGIEVEEKNLNTLVIVAVELISDFMLCIMETDCFKLQQMLSDFLISLWNCCSLRKVIIKQILYWICWLKNRLISVIQESLSLEDKLLHYLNNVSYMFILFENLVTVLVQDSNHSGNSNKSFHVDGDSSHNKSVSNEYSTNNYVDNNILQNAKEQIEQNLFVCFERFPIFSNWVCSLGFRLNEFLKKSQS